MFALLVTAWVMFAVKYAILAVGAFALVHAVRQRPDAFPAVDKLTKGKWLAIIVGSAAAVLLFGFNGSGFLLSLIGTTAICVYLADVRPKVDEVQRGSRW